MPEGLIVRPALEALQPADLLAQVPLSLPSDPPPYERLDQQASQLVSINPLNILVAPWSWTPQNLILSFREVPRSPDSICRTRRKPAITRRASRRRQFAAARLLPLLRQ